MSYHCPHCGGPALSIPDNVRQWLLTGERGISSEAIVTHLLGLPVIRYTSMSPPHDAWDLRRCRLLLEEVPELMPMFDRMREVNTYWAKVVNLWPELCSVMDAEWPGWRAPRRGMTYSRGVDAILREKVFPA